MKMAPTDVAMALLNTDFAKDDPEQGVPLARLSSETPATSSPTSRGEAFHSYFMSIQPSITNEKVGRDTVGRMTGVDMASEEREKAVGPVKGLVLRTIILSERTWKNYTRSVRKANSEG